MTNTTPAEFLRRARYATVETCAYASEPLPSEASRRKISFMHPGYPELDNPVILRLPKVDLDNGGRLGVVHTCAYHACIILANNKPGFLSLSADRTAPRGLPGVDGQADPLLILTAKALDGQCCITHYDMGLRTVHLIPRSEAEWVRCSPWQ
jgi:hypothetical protein